MRTSTIIVRIDFPALDSLIAFLREQNNQQDQIDALAAKVTELTDKLHHSQQPLQGAIQNEQGGQ